MKGTLASFPNCVHWHWKRGKERGTLEITWWGKQDRLWFKVAAGRFHTALGYWNETYHHGTYLHTSITRPVAVRFEDYAEEEASAAA